MSYNPPTPQGTDATASRLEREVFLLPLATDRFGWAGIDTWSALAEAPSRRPDYPPGFPDSLPHRSASPAAGMRVRYRAIEIGERTRPLSHCAGELSVPAQPLGLKPATLGGAGFNPP